MFTQRDPAAIQVEELPDGVRYVFPRLPGAGCLRVIFLPLVLMGAMFMAMPVLALVVACYVGLNEGPSEMLIVLVFSAMSFVVGLVGLVAFGIGMHILAGNSELELSSGVLISRVGWWRLKRSSRRAVDSVTRLVIASPLSATSRSGGRTYQRSPDGRLQHVGKEEAQRQLAEEWAQSRYGTLFQGILANSAEYAILEVHCGSQAPLFAAWGQSPEQLVLIAQDLGRRCGVPFEDRTRTLPNEGVIAELDEDSSSEATLTLTDDDSEAPEDHDAVTMDLDTLPIATSSASFRDKKLVQLGPHEWILRASWTNQLLLGGFCFVGLVFLVGIIAAKGAAVLRNQEAVLGVGALTMFVLLSGAAAFGPLPTKLDRAARTVTYGYRWRRSMRDLTDVHAVQVIPGQRSSGRGKRYQPFELNLAFRDGQRINLSNHADLRWTRETAQLLADFLNVPLVDQA